MDEKATPKGQSNLHERPQYPAQQQPGSPGAMLLLLFVMILLIIEPGIREAAGVGMGSILEPRIGFDGQYPHLTIFLAGLIMVFITTTIRHFFMDWVKMAEIQFKMKAFNKKMNELRTSGGQENFEKVQRLTEKHRPEFFRMNAEMQSYQMKPMAFTMMVAIPIFMWLYIFIKDIPDGGRYVSLPWEPKWWLDNRMIFPYWVALYSLLSIPIGQSYQRTLKYFNFKERQGKEAAERHIKAQKELDLCELALGKLGEDDILYREGEKKLKKARESTKEKEYLGVLSLCNEITVGLDTVKKEHFEAQKEIDVVGEIMKREAQMDLGGSKKNLEEAEKDFERGEYSSAIFYARKAKRIIRELSEMQSEKDKQVADLRFELEGVTSEFPDLDVKRIEDLIVEAEESKDKEFIAETVEQGFREIKKAKQYLLDASSTREKLEKALARCDEVDISTSSELEILDELAHHYREKDYHNYLKKGGELLLCLEKKLDQKEELLSNLSHAELLISNAMNFGGDVSKAQKLLLQARAALEEGDEERAVELANSTMKAAEAAKASAKK